MAIMLSFSKVKISQKNSQSKKNKLFRPHPSIPVTPFSFPRQVIDSSLNSSLEYLLVNFSHLSSQYTSGKFLGGHRGRLNIMHPEPVFKFVAQTCPYLLNPPLKKYIN